MGGRAGTAHATTYAAYISPLHLDRICSRDCEDDYNEQIADVSRTHLRRSPSQQKHHLIHHHSYSRLPKACIQPSAIVS
jgi:hypothetical protein